MGGDTHLGGIDFDQRLVEHFAREQRMVALGDQIARKHKETLTRRFENGDDKGRGRVDFRFRACDAR